MNIFTYKDYIDFTNDYILREEIESYNLNKSKIYQKHDITYKKILSDKNELAIFLNEVLKINNKDYEIKPNNLEEYKTDFINQDLSKREADIIYKLKNDNIFFLIEHQSSIDYLMPFRLLEYCVSIIRKEINTKEAKRKDYKLPLICPIVLYTGKNKWRNKILIEDHQKIWKGYNKPFTNYELIDINNYSKDELLNKTSLLSKVLFLEKSKDTKELIHNLDKIIELKYTNKEKQSLINMINLIFSKTIGDEKTNELINRLEEGSKKESMIEEIIIKDQQKQYRKGRKEGKKEGKEEGEKTAKINIAIKMIRNKMEDSAIIEMIEISKEELEDIKKENK